MVWRRYRRPVWPAASGVGAGMEIVLVLVVVGVLVLAAWPFVVRRSGREERSPADQGEVTDRTVIPPRRPDTPIPGSQPDRERHGKP
jgi:hypothetical protein